MYYHVEPLFPGLTRIWDIAHTAMYLVEGEHRAALIDTGVGVGDLKSVVNGLTSKPLTVLISHGHVDHAMGAGAFDDVRMSTLDATLYVEHSALKERKGYVQGCAMQSGDPTLAEKIAESDYQSPKELPEIGSLNAGDHFDLGGVTVEVLRGEGHTPGSLTMLIPEWRTLFLGDACNQFTFLFDHWSSPLTKYRDMLLQLKAETDGRYDRVLVSHAFGDGCVSMIDNVINVCDAVLAGTADNLPFQTPFGSGLIAKAMDFSHCCCADGSEGNIVYNPNYIR